MKEFVWINRIFFLNLAFGQVGEKMMAKTENISLFLFCFKYYVYGKWGCTGQFEKKLYFAYKTWNTFT